MRAIGTGLAAALAIIASAGIAQAQSPYSYPWCEYYLGGRDGGTSCYFTSYAQCMASARGNGAYCARNPQYRPSAGRLRAQRQPQQPWQDQQPWQWQQQWQPQPWEQQGGYYR